MNQLKPILARFAALNVRERILALVVVTGAIYFVFDTAFLRPQQLQSKAVREKIAQQQQEMIALNAAMQALMAPRQADPLAKQRAERDELLGVFTQAQAVVEHASANVHMGEVVRRMVAARPGLTLVSLKTLPVETFFRGSAPAGGNAPVPTLYKHGIEVTVQGNYLALVPYLQELERNGSGIFWGNVKMDVIGYPDATLKMTVYTLSARPELPLG